MVAADLRVEVIARGRAEHAPAGCDCVIILGGSGLLRRMHWALTLPWRARGATAITFDPDLVPMALLRRWVTPGRRLVVDVHEDYRALLADRRWARGMVGRLATALAQIATALAERADLTLVADEHVPPVLARNRMVLRNLADPALLPPLAAPSTQPHMVYIGDVRTSRGLKAMLAALEQAPAWTLDIVGRVDANDQQWLDTWQQTSPAATRLTMHGQLPPSIAWQHAQTAWVGLVLLQPTPAFVAAMPSKVYEYEACGLTVVTTNLPRQQAWLNSGGVGVSIPSGDDTAVASAVARALLAIQQDPGLVHQARERAAQVRNQSPYAQFAQAIAQLSQRG